MNSFQEIDELSLKCVQKTQIGKGGHSEKTFPSKMTITVTEKIEQSNILQDKKQRTMPKMPIAITTNKKIPFLQIL